VGVIIIREMVGTSPQSWSDAARRAVATASKTVRNIRTIEQAWGLPLLGRSAHVAPITGIWR